MYTRRQQYWPIHADDLLLEEIELCGAYNTTPVSFSRSTLSMVGPRRRAAITISLRFVTKRTSEMVGQTRDRSSLVMQWTVGWSTENVNPVIWRFTQSVG